MSVLSARNDVLSVTRKQIRHTMLITLLTSSSWGYEKLIPKIFFTARRRCTRPLAGELPGTRAPTGGPMDITVSGRRHRLLDTWSVLLGRVTPSAALRSHPPLPLPQKFS